ncbi:hypothetical protein [uncultured Photobacterium sp.]|uniref:hypothetical protein n=1 Tax=uncultured Photobacterium sp. TaxID=173973 RepID=UPI0026139C83|nr:hypothetical protein [uncultured Photobacterium sp.]
MSDLCSLILKKFTLLDRECEAELKNVISNLHAEVKYDGGRICIPDLKNAGNLLSKVISDKSKLFLKEFERIMSTQETRLSQDDFFKLQTYIGKTFSEERYIRRYEILIKGIEMKVARYGLKFDSGKYRVDLYATLYEVSVKNSLAVAVSSLNTELELYFGSKNTLNSVNEVFDIKPNVMGIGINFNALISKIFPANKRR